MTRLIELVPVSGDAGALLQSRNVGRVCLRGVDLAVEQRLAGSWLWRASASWVDARDDAGERLTNAPSWIFKGHVISPEWRRAQLGVEWSLLGPRLGRVAVPSTVIVNAHLRWRLADRQTLALHADNVLDRRNLDPATPDTPLSAIPQPRRSLRLDWTVSF